MSKPNASEQPQAEQPEEDKKAKCGIVMPIAGGGEYSREHWQDVRSIIQDALSEAGGLNREVQR